MKKILVLAAVAGMSVTMINCSSTKPAASADAAPAMSSAEKVAAIKSKFSSDQISEGKTLTEANCQKCHKLKDPTVRTVEKLERVLPGMIRKAKLTDEQGELVRAYMLSHAQDA